KCMFSSVLQSIPSGQTSPEELHFPHTHKQTHTQVRPAQKSYTFHTHTHKHTHTQVRPAQKSYTFHTTHHTTDTSTPHTTLQTQAHTTPHTTNTSTHHATDT